MKIFCIILLSLIGLFTSCDEPNLSTDLIESFNKQYPSKLNYEWEYSLNSFFELYDSTGRIDSSFNYQAHNILTKVKRIDISRNSMVFESKGLDSMYFEMEEWYENSAEGFYAKYYSIPFTSILPKKSDDLKIDLLHQQNMFSVLPCDAIKTFGKPLPAPWPFDPPRIVLKYPLSVGMSWIEEVNPNYKVRTVISYDEIYMNNMSFKCYVLESREDSLKKRTLDFIDLNAGLAKRVVSQDSVIYGNIYTQWRYARVTSTANLIRKNF